MIDYSCAEFDDFSFSRFGYIMRTDRQTHRQNHSRPTVQYSFIDNIAAEEPDSECTMNKTTIKQNKQYD